MTDLTAEQVVELLATGWSLRRHDLGGYDGTEYRVEKNAGEVLPEEIRRLQRASFLESYPSGCDYRLSDKGHRAYLKSTDEMGDGRLEIPQGTGGER